MVKNPPANAGEIRALDLISGSKRYPGGGHGNPLQYSCLENSNGQKSLAPIVHKVAKNWTLLKWPTEKAMAPHSSTLAWKIPWMEEPGRLQSMGPLRVGHD